MIIRSRVNEIKREQKKSFLLRELTELIYRVSQDEPEIAGIYITHVDLSADSGICYVYFATAQGPLTSEELFQKALERLKLYKPSLRKALAKAMKSRYVPDLIFRFDEKNEKVRHINELLDDVHEELEHADEEE